MIQLVEGSQAEEMFFDLCRGSAFGCKLAACAGAYGFQLPFARFWLGSGCAFGLLDGALVLTGHPVDWAEVQAFLGSLGPELLCCREDFASPLGLRIKNQGPVLGKELSGKSGSGAVVSQEPLRLELVHRLLVQCGMAGPWEPFYLDLSHRLRHDGALVLREYREGRLAGCALALLAGEEALLSALAVEEEFRGQGMGSRLVARMETALAGRKLYVLRQTGRNREFYRRLGYREEDRWAEGKTLGRWQGRGAVSPAGSVGA
ncbi:GNAT family N-acetyltransferase [Acutalibacter sp. 1XD8-33]|uniref:GNAT family N-acetyltransferase n=1 Tax=Acutalibacter sp. 1XD8-33 TaxID=2320081 RepID=UPI000EA2311B|nr:GNAT family N-acetyltransferase [Acutalibacter sp. 1XD8-33]RKJ41752.1 GNAT family N-acetyltransferase [Acutalibacter sp. 1XD8-33]